MERAGARTDLPLRVVAYALDALDFLPETLEIPFVLRLALLVALGLLLVVAREEAPWRLLAGAFSDTICVITAF